MGAGQQARHRPSGVRAHVARQSADWSRQRAPAAARRLPGAGPAARGTLALVPKAPLAHLNDPQNHFASCVAGRHGPELVRCCLVLLASAGAECAYVGF
jgi:hypothetical protein